MDLGRPISQYSAIAALVALLGLGTFWLLSRQDQEGHTVKVTVPPLSASAARGKSIFDVNCASCHGLNAAGTDQGPPLVHNIYEPGHHADGAFYLAAKVGVRQHHWRFGNMPPQPQISEIQMKAVVQYIRQLQVANGIASPEAVSGAR